MKITVEATRFGALEIDDQTVLNFPNGLVGFETSKRYAILHESLVPEETMPKQGDGNGKLRQALRDDEHIVRYLQCLDDPDLTLPVVDPSMFGFDYDMTLTADELDAMEVRPGDYVAVLLIVGKYREDRYREDLLPRQNISANISGPILINTRSRIGMQKVLTDLTYNVTFHQGQGVRKASASTGII